MNSIPPPPSAVGKAKPKMSFAAVPPPSGHRIILHGQGGVGKTTLALKIPGSKAFFDFDDSLPILLSKESDGIDRASVLRVPTESTTFDGVLDALASYDWSEVKTLVIDTATVFEAKIDDYLFANPDKFPTGNNKRTVATSMNDYAFKCGYGYKEECFRRFLAALDRFVNLGHNVVLICHSAPSVVPNLRGEDVLQWQPDLWQAGKFSDRLVAKGWADHIGFLFRDFIGKEGGKGENLNGVSIKWEEDPCFCVAKSRTLNGDAAELDVSDFDWSMLGIN